jgi:signal transduction histidine kinase
MTEEADAKVRPNEHEPLKGGSMHNALARFFERYRMHHDMDRTLLQWIGVVGAVAFPLFYLLRRTSIVPPRYDDLELRVVATLLCVGLALRRWWPARLRPYYMAYSWLAAFYCLSFLLSFTSLKNQGGSLSLINMVMGTILIMLLADWRNAVAMLLAGYVSSAALYRVIDPGATIPPELALAAVTSVLVVVVGALSHHSQKRAEIQRQRIYAGVAGSVAHEVRTPLAQVQFALDTITEQVAEGKNPVQAVADGRQAVRRGLQAINLTLRQLNDHVLDSAAFTDLSAGHCVRHAVDEYAYETPQQRERVQVVITQDFVLRGDETALVLVLYNLLKNALYYLPLYPHERVTLQVEAEPVCRIVVHDTGPGIAPELATELFEEFGTAGKPDGTGLGLAFCRRAMRAFGGDIGCESRVGEFTSFILTFPHSDPVSLPGTARAVISQ